MDNETIGTPVGPYGTVIEHPLLRGLFYMVLGPCDQGENSLYGMTLADNSGFHSSRTPGEVIVLGCYLRRGDSSDWIVVE